KDSTQDKYISEGKIIYIGEGVEATRDFLREALENSKLGGQQEETLWYFGDEFNEGGNDVPVLKMAVEKGILCLSESSPERINRDVGALVTTYGKDYPAIASYFGDDPEKFHQAFLGWQKEFKQLLNQDKTLEQLTTFKDDQHKDGTEYFLVTDKNGNYIYDEQGNHIIRPRDLCHVDGTWHRSVFMFLVDKEGRILVQVRSDKKKFFPGCRDTSASGHLGLAVEYIDGAINETEEEVFDSQIKLDRSRIVRVGEDAGLTVIHESVERGLKDWERSSLYVYFITDEEKALIKKQESEVKDLEWVTFDEETSRWQEWKNNPGESRKQGIDYAALGIDILSNPAIVLKVKETIADHVLCSILSTLTSKYPALDKPVNADIKFGTSGTRWDEYADYTVDGVFQNDLFLNDFYSALFACAEQVRQQESLNPGRQGVIIAGDTRSVGPYSNLDLIEMASEFISRLGVKVIKIDHYAPLPAISCLITLLGAASSIYFTASHNPGKGYAIQKEDGSVVMINNDGIKFNPADSGPAGEEITGPINKNSNEIRKAMYGNSWWTDILSNSATGMIEELSFDKAFHLYYEAMQEVVDFEVIKEAFASGRVNYIVIDVKHGAASQYYKAIMISLGFEENKDFEIINSEADSSFTQLVDPDNNILRADRPEPDAKYSKHLIWRVRQLAGEGKKVIGIACDADADRNGITDTTGEFIDPNMTLAIESEYSIQQAFIKWLNTNYPQIHLNLDQFINSAQVGAVIVSLIKEFILSQNVAIAKTIPTSNIINAIVNFWGCILKETKVGFKWFRPYLLADSKEPVLIAGEESQGLNHKSSKNNPKYVVLEKDALVAGLKMLEIVSRTGLTPLQLASKLQDNVGYFAYNRGGVDLRTKVALDQIDILKKTLKVQLDALKKEITEGRINEIGGKAIKQAIFDDGYKFVFSDDSWFCIRFSGTEPIVRLYTEATAPTMEEAEIIRKELQRIGEGLLEVKDTSDSARPVPGQPMPTRNEVNNEINRIGWDNTQALAADAAEIKLAISYLRSINENPMADYLKYLVEAGLIRAGPFQGFLASTYISADNKEYIVLSNSYPVYNTTLERAASLVHEVGATFKFGDTHKINTERENSFKASIRKSSLLSNSINARTAVFLPIFALTSTLDEWKTQLFDLISKHPYISIILTVIVIVWIYRRVTRVSRLIRKLSDSHPYVRSSSAYDLGKLGDKRAVEPLIKALGDSDFRVRSSSTIALEELGATKEQIVDGYLKALSSPNSDVRSSSTEALGKLGDKRAVEPLIKALGDSDFRVRSSS
ncbi:MAG: HEAT repeat domain-containing protein, partial [Candidatus Omnitrophota bacterium]